MSPKIPPHIAHLVFGGTAMLFMVSGAAQENEPAPDPPDPVPAEEPATGETDKPVPEPSEGDPEALPPVEEGGLPAESVPPLETPPEESGFDLPDPDPDFLTLPVPALPTTEGVSGEDGTFSPAPFDLYLKDGRVLHDFWIRGRTPAGLMVFHRTGASDIPAHLLPDYLVEAYRLDPEASPRIVAEQRARQADSALKKIEEQEEGKALQSLSPVIVEGTVKSVSEDGIIVECPDPPQLEEQGLQRIGGVIRTLDGKVPAPFKERIFGTLWVTEHPEQASLVDGDRLIFRARISGRRQEGGVTYRALTFERRGR